MHTYCVCTHTHPQACVFASIFLNPLLFIQLPQSHSLCATSKKIWEKKKKICFQEKLIKLLRRWFPYKYPKNTKIYFPADMQQESTPNMITKLYPYTAILYHQNFDTLHKIHNMSTDSICSSNVLWYFRFHWLWRYDDMSSNLINTGSCEWTWINGKHYKPETAKAVAPSISTRLAETGWRQVMPWLTADFSLKMAKIQI